LKATDQSELWRVCEALGKLRAAEAVPRLIELLEDEVTGVDSAAATALGQIGDLRVLTPLIEQLKKHKSSVYSVIAALYHFGERAVLPLTEVLFDADAGKVHDLALMELGMLKDQRANRHILRYLDTLSNSTSKLPAISALGKLKAEEAVAGITELFHTATDFDIRYGASVALAEIGSRQAFEALLRELKHGTAENQHAAALAFGNMEHIEDIEPLLNALKNSSPDIRSAIAVSLGNLRDRRALMALEEALNDTDENTRHYAQVGIDKINQIDWREAGTATE
jgi:HEAT repeat protein